MHAQGLATRVATLPLGPGSSVEERRFGRTGARLESVDVLRGIAVAGMVLVDNPGSWTDAYAPLVHAQWNGCTLADLVFPYFLFVVGISIAISLGRKMESGDDSYAIARNITRRAATMFAIGLLLNAVWSLNLVTLRIPGVLQRIALCYALASLLFLRTGIRGQSAAVAGLLCGYWLLITLVPVPGHGAGSLDEQGNLAAYIDRIFLRGHMYHKEWDPEGILSTAPALATTLLGVLAGQWLRDRNTESRRAPWLIAAGFIAFVAGQILGRWLPVNKQLWTSSFAILTSGSAAASLGVCYWLVDELRYRRWATPFLALGTNALPVYVLTSIGATLMERVPVASGIDGPEGLRLFVFERVFLPWAGCQGGSLLFAVVVLLAWLVPMTLLYRRRIVIAI